MLRFTRAEISLFLIPLLIVPAVILTRKLKVAYTPKPAPIPTATPIPVPNLYSNYYVNAEVILPSPDGKLIHVGERNNKTKFSTWNARTGDLVRRFGVFRLGNADGVLSPSGAILGFGHGGWNGKRVVLFDSATGKERLQIPKPKATGYGFALNDEVVTLPTNDHIHLLSTRNGKLVGKLHYQARDFYPTKPQFSPDGKRLLWIGFPNRDFDSYANGNSHDEVVWFDWKKRKRIHAIEFPQTELSWARFSGDGKVILASGFRHYWVKSRTLKSEIATEVRFFAIDARTGRQLYTWHINDWPHEVAVSPDGQWFTFQTEKGEGSQSAEYLSVYAVKTGQEVHDVKGWFTNSGAWSADSKTLYIDNGPMWRLKLQNNRDWKLNKGKSSRN